MLDRIAEILSFSACFSTSLSPSSSLSLFSPLVSWFQTACFLLRLALTISSSSRKSSSSSIICVSIRGSIHNSVD